jgi:hypothetical protein
MAWISIIAPPARGTSLVSERILRRDTARRYSAGNAAHPVLHDLPVHSPMSSLSDHDHSAVGKRMLHPKSRGPKIVVGKNSTTKTILVHGIPSRAIERTDGQLRTCRALGISLSSALHVHSVFIDPQSSGRAVSRR